MADGCVRLGPHPILASMTSAVATAPSTLGPVRVELRDGRIVAIDFEPSDQQNADAVAAAASVAAFIDGEADTIPHELAIDGTPFQRSVWQALRDTRPGETISYTELAARVGRPQAARAVASACGANRLAVAIPCHRIVRKDGGLGGFRWGLDRKRALLKRERLG